jgi:L-histidine Nalpha-methyltransferase
MRPSAAPPTSSHASSIDAADREFAADVEYYLTLQPRQLPSRYLYDALGSALFEAICELPWYRITRAELALLEAHAADVFRRSAPVSRIIELGPGNGSKLLTLMRGRVGTDGPAERESRAEAESHARTIDVHLVDVSAKALDAAGQALTTLPDVRVEKHGAAYEEGLVNVTARATTEGRTLLLFLGSNIGNFDPPGAAAFLRVVRGSLAAGDDLLIGVDLVKPEAELLLAYDDPLGVTAAFNRNLLVRINRELGADFDLAAFDHCAVWNDAESRIEMHLVSRHRQHVRIPAAHIDMELEAGETIWTESSYKYELDDVMEILGRAGFRRIAVWTAAEARFALALVRADG